jgi:hypothetical protein
MRLMAKAAICFSNHDAAFAAELSKYLELHTSVGPELAECENPGDFLDVIEQCLVFQIVVVVLSSKSVPVLWPLADWERVLVECVRESGSQVAYFKCESCPFPQVLRRRAFFDSFLTLRQWTIHIQNPDRNPPRFAQGEEDQMLMPLLNQPGLISDVTRSGAEWFIANYWRLFEGVYRVESGGWTRAGVLGEVSQAMGVRLAGTVDQNLARLKLYAAEERALYVFENLPEEFSELAELGGRSSVMVLAKERDASPVTVDQLHSLFFSSGSEEAVCLRMLGKFMNREQASDGDWARVKAIGMRARLFFQREMRLAEAHELLVWLAIQAQRHGDRQALEQIQREENWILNSWDLPPVERTELVGTQPSQLWLYPLSLA